MERRTLAPVAPFIIGARRKSVAAVQKAVELTSEGPLQVMGNGTGGLTIHSEFFNGSQQRAMSWGARNEDGLSANGHRAMRTTRRLSSQVDSLCLLCLTRIVRQLGESPCTDPDARADVYKLRSRDLAPKDPVIL